MQIVFKNKTRLNSNFHFKDRIFKGLTFRVVYKFQCGLCNEPYYGECVRHLSLSVCSCHFTYAFQSDSTLYSCLNVKELLARSRREI